MILHSESPFTSPLYKAKVEMIARPRKGRIEGVTNKLPLDVFHAGSIEGAMYRLLLTSTSLLVLLVGASTGGCDSVDESRFGVEVTEVRAIETSFGAPSFTVGLQSTGSEPLSRVDIEFTVFPQDQLKSGVSTGTLAPGASITAEVVLLQVEGHGDYECYTSSVRAFAPAESKAVIIQAGPATCE